MAHLSEHSRKVMELVLAGQVNEAEGYIAQELTRDIESIRAELASMERERTLLTTMISLAKKEDRAGVGAPHARVRTLSKEERSDAIKKSAYEAAIRKGGKVTTDDVLEELARDNLELGGAAPGTAIGNVLYKDPEHWKHIEKGVFQYVGK